MPQDITLKGYDFKNGRFVVSKIHVELNDSDTLPGYSQPISQAAFTEMQRRFLAAFDAKYNNASDDEKKEIEKTTIAVTFGKQALELILAQEGCEGIRFSFAQSFEEDKHETLVAQGVAFDPEDPKKIVPVMQPVNPRREGPNETTSALYFEVVPPNTYGDWLKNKDNNQVLFML